MHFPRLAALALGAWLGGTLLVLLFSSQNVRLVNDLIRAPVKEAVDHMVKIQESELRLILNYHASEGNRWLRSNWELAELGLGVVLLLTLFFAPGGKRYLIIVSLLMIFAVVFQHWFLSPEIDRLSPAAGFDQPDAVSVARDRLRSLESGYWTSQALTLVLGLLLAAGLAKRSRRHRQDRHEKETESSGGF
jgi:hypothetical protein